MSTRDTEMKNPDVTFFLLLVLFYGVLLKGNPVGALNWIWVTLMGAIIVGISVAAILIHRR